MSPIEEKIEAYQKALSIYKQSTNQMNLAKTAFEESKDLQSSTLAHAEEARKIMLRAIEDELWNKVPPA